MLLIPERELGVAVLMNKNLSSLDAAYENIGWNSALLALGLEPSVVAPELEFIPRYGRLLGALVVLLLAGGVVLSARILLCRPSDDASERRRAVR